MTTPRFPRVIRPAMPSDRALIIDSWQKTFLGQSREHPGGTGPLSHMVRQEYYDCQKEAIDQLIALPETVVKVACHAEDSDHVLGWVCCSAVRPLLHFLYVGALYRRDGIATALMASCFAGLGTERITATHWTRTLPCYRQKWRLVYNPFELYGLIKEIG